MKCITIWKNSRTNSESQAVSLKIMENQCTSKASIQFADDTQLENTTRVLKGFKWIQNDPDMLDKTWIIRE